MSEQIHPEDIGRVAMVEKVAAGVRVAMEQAGITDVADVHYVQTKTPLLTLDTITDAKRRGHDVWTEDTLKSMDVSNSTTALGIAVALGEIEMPTSEQIHKDLTLFSAVASCSSGVELDQAQIVVVGNVRGHGGRYQVGHSVMKDALDADGVWEAIRSAGVELPDRPHPSDLGTPGRERLLQVRGRPDRPGPRPAQHHARRLRRPLAPADQGLRRRGRRLGDRRPGGVRVGRRRPPGPVRRWAGHRDRRPRGVGVGFSGSPGRAVSGTPACRTQSAQPGERSGMSAVVSRSAWPTGPGRPSPQQWRLPAWRWSVVATADQGAARVDRLWRSHWRARGRRSPQLISQLRRSIGCGDLPACTGRWPPQLIRVPRR